MAILLKIQI